MKPKRKKLKRIKWTPDADGIICAWIVFFGLYEEVDELMPCACISPETAVIKDDLYQKLSTEAREVIETIINAPKDFTDECIAPKTGRFKYREDDNAYFIKRFFRKKWGSRLLVRKVFRELEMYIKKII